MSMIVLEETCQADLKGKPVEVAVLPIGSCEVHGLHLPYGTDAFQAGIFARRAAAISAAPRTLRYHWRLPPAASTQPNMQYSPATLEQNVCTLP